MDMDMVVAVKVFFDVNDDVNDDDKDETIGRSIMLTSNRNRRRT